MMIKRKIWGFVFVVLALMVILSGCESGSSGDSADVVYNFAGSVGKGDFINVEVNMADKLIDYEIEDLSNPEAITQKESYIFSDDVKDFYITNNDQDYFLMLNNEVLIATDSKGNEGEQIITAFSEPASSFGQEIEKKI
ncbi:hypothetical protein [Halanaerobium sp.]|uniref:hypothetical protein n=1 Tax=Halanaerobium sp. TaxID=1895664 RepID=UPI000DE74E22|nr:hypothetical protein [Halanaerobium sp.]PUU89245.1 MAG: hypothetical protein CI949_2795 [Halanaerobium sp.]